MLVGYPKFEKYAIMKTLEECLKVRADLEKAIKTVGKAVTRLRELEAEIFEIEKSCRVHAWTERVYVKNADQFRRKCSKCGKEKFDKS